MGKQPSQKVINGLIYGLGVALPIVLIAVELALWFFYWKKSKSATVNAPVVTTNVTNEEEEEAPVYPNLFYKHMSNEYM